RWLCKAFAPHRVAQTIDEMYVDQVDVEHDAKADIAKAKIARVETKMVRYRAALEARRRPGGDRQVDRRGQGRTGQGRGRTSHNHEERRMSERRPPPLSPRSATGPEPSPRSP